MTRVASAAGVAVNVGGESAEFTSAERGRIAPAVIDARYNHLPANIANALHRFSQSHAPVTLRSEAQIRTLNHILSDPNGGEFWGQIYLGLVAAGVGPVPVFPDDTRLADIPVDERKRIVMATASRVQEIMDVAAQLWVGKNAPQGFGDTPLQRLARLADGLRTLQERGPITTDGVRGLRERMLLRPEVQFRDEFDSRGRVRLEPIAGQGPRDLGLGLSPERAPRDYIRDNSITRVFNYAEPPRRGQNDVILGTGEAWTPGGVAMRVHRWIDGIGTENEKGILDVTHGLAIEDRVLVAEEFARIRGKNLQGISALEFLLDELKDDLGGRDVLIMKAQLRADNLSGRLQPHDLIQLATSGFWREDGASLQRLIMRLSREDLLLVDQALQRDYDTSLDDAVNELTGTIRSFFGGESIEEARLRFLMKAPRDQSGRVPVAYVRAFELHYAVDGAGTEEGRIFRILESMTAQEIRDVAKAFHELYPDERGDGGDGQKGDIAASALYHRLYSDLHDLTGPSALWVKRLALAMNGLQQAPSSVSDPAADRVQRERAANYIAIATELYVQRGGVSRRVELENDPDVLRENESAGADMFAVMSLFRPAGQEHLDGRPSAGDVASAHQRLFPNGADYPVRALAASRGPFKELLDIVANEGKGGPMSPAAAALRIHHAIDDGFLGLRGSKEEVVYDILDRSDLDAAGRTAFLAAVQVEYQKRFGETLKKALTDEFGETMELPTGRSVPARALVLLEHGTLTPAERFVYSLHEPGLFNIFGKTDTQTLVGTISNLTPLEKVIAVINYNRIMGYPEANIEAGANELVRDVQQRDLPGAAALLNIMPYDADALALQAYLFVENLDHPALGEFIGRNFRDEDARLPGVQSRGLERLLALVQQHGVEGLARKAKVTDEQLVANVQKLVGDARANGFSNMLMDWLGPQGASIEHAARELGSAVRQAVLNPDGTLKGQPDEVDLGQLQVAAQSFYAQLGEYTQLRGETNEFFANVGLTIAIVSTLVAAPQASPWLSALIGAAVKPTMHAALGEYELASVAKNAFRGGVAGLMAGIGAQHMMGLPADVAVGTKLAQGSLSGFTAGAAIGASYDLTNPEMLSKGVVRAVRETTDRAIFEHGVRGAATGLVLTAAFHYGEIAYRKLFGPKPQRPVEPQRPDEPPPQQGPGEGVREPAIPAEPQPPGQGVREPAIPAEPQPPGQGVREPAIPSSSPIPGGSGVRDVMVGDAPIPSASGTRDVAVGGGSQAFGGTPVPSAGLSEAAASGSASAGAGAAGSVDAGAAVAGAADAGAAGGAAATGSAGGSGVRDVAVGGAPAPAGGGVRSVSSALRAGERAATGPAAGIATTATPVSPLQMSGIGAAPVVGSPTSFVMPATPMVGTITGPIEVATAAAVVAAGAFALALQNGEPKEVLQTLLAGQARLLGDKYAREGGPVAEALWGQALEHARAAGIDVADAPPPSSPRRQLEFLRGLEVRAARAATATPVAERSTPEMQAAPAVPETTVPIAPERPRERTPSRRVGSAGRTPTKAERPATTDVAATQNAKLREQALLSDADEAWVARQLGGTFELLTGLSQGALGDRVSLRRGPMTAVDLALVQQWLGDKEVFPGDTTLVERLRGVKRGLGLFGLDARDAQSERVVEGDFAALDRVLSVFGPAFQFPKDQARLSRIAAVQNIEQVASIMRAVYRFHGIEDVPASATALALRTLVKGYQEHVLAQLGIDPAPFAAKLGTFDVQLIQLQRQFVQAERAKTEAVRTLGQAKQSQWQTTRPVVEKAIQALGEGKFDNETIGSTVAGLTALWELQDIKEAKTLYQTATQQLQRALGKATARQWEEVLLHLAKSPWPDSEGERVVLRPLLDRSIHDRQEIARAVAQQTGYDLSDLPVGVLDLLDEHALQHSHKEKLKNATVARKALETMVSQDPGVMGSDLWRFFFSQPVHVIVERIRGAETSVSHDVLARKIAWASGTKGGEILRELAKQDGGLASDLLSRAIDARAWDLRDDFVRSYANPTGNGFDRKTLEPLTVEVRGKMVQVLLDPSWFSVHTDADEELANLLKQVGIPKK